VSVADMRSMLHGQRPHSWCDQGLDAAFLRAAAAGFGALSRSVCGV